MGYAAHDLLAAIKTVRNSTELLANDVGTLGLRLFRAFERPPFYRTKMRTRSEQRGYG
jgi:hypothetical protein